ncbi:MAG: hypothetical protein H7Y13_04940 [Sphingobacteriaceae bacterium]|nr:hypothetical protein [Sphingobacteriaceae bacterium]
MTQDAFEKDYYQRISGIKIPEGYKVLESVDNGEFLTITVLEFDKAECKSVMDSIKFDLIPQGKNPNLIGLYLLDKENEQILKNKRLLRNWGQTDKNTWNYVLDTVSCRLYCEIGYPDPGGN